MTTTPVAIAMPRATLPQPGKRTFIYYFGGYDPSGIDIARNTRQQFRRFSSPDTEIEFRRVPVTPEQVQEMGLSTRPTKRTDSRARSWEGGRVEVDAIRPAELRMLGDDLIAQRVDKHALDVLLAAEESERELLGMLARKGKRS